MTTRSVRRLTARSMDRETCKYTSLVLRYVFPNRANHPSTVPDPLVMAPFLPGDFITFKGFRKGDEVIATRIVAENVQVLIDGDLVYLRVDPGIVSVYSPNIARVVDETEVSYTMDTTPTEDLVAGY